MKPIENGLAIHKNDEITETLLSVGHYTNVKPGITLDPSLMEKALSDYLNDDSYPLPLTSDREGYHGSAHYDYWLSGLKDYLSIKQLIARHGTDWPENSPIFDLGCASGRVLRHFLTHEGKMAIWGADINNRHVEWIRRYLPGSVIVFQNTTLPHLPVEDNTFALVYAFSVMTHIDFETAWLLEIRRILKNRGYAYLSFHSEHTWEIMGPPLSLYKALAENNEYIKEYDVRLELFKHPMPKAKTVFTCSKDDIYNCNIFYTIDYIRKEWGRIFKVVDIMHEYHDYQDVVLLQKV